MNWTACSGSSPGKRNNPQECERWHKAWAIVRMWERYPAGVFHDAGGEPEKFERCIFDLAETPAGKVQAVRVYMGG